ncbi:MAG: DNA lyase [Candidatus Aenigmarchaeota archaeon]|nr:DNA lyase [Candidatus Aenigmarchaeota archaeon]
MQEILNTYKKEKPKIDKFLQNAKKKSSNKEDVFFELCFCLLTPQSKAPLCRTSLKNLSDSGKLSGSSAQFMAKDMKSVRFCNNKAKYLVHARERRDEIFDKITELKNSPKELREYLAKNVKGYGYKEASHFLRNIGLGEELAILDRHILRYMMNFGFEELKFLSRKNYLDYEAKFVEFAKGLGLKPAELDIAIWLSASGNEEIM